MADDESGSNIRELWALPDLLWNYGPSQTGPSESNIGQLLEPQLMPPQVQPALMVTNAARPQRELFHNNYFGPRQFGAPAFPLTRPHTPGAHVTPIELGAPVSPLARLPAPGSHVTPIGDQSTEGLNIVPAAPRAMPLSLRPMPRPQSGIMRPYSAARAMPLRPMRPQFGFVMRPSPAPQGSPKTRMCDHWLRGFCKMGAYCNFAHGFLELRPTIRHPLYRTRNCPNLNKEGFCRFGQYCIFRH